ncbi:MAG: hypothetical protein RLZ10_1660 [Bacteroidota bacterium]|jgi:hypothetical protein
MAHLKHFSSKYHARFEFGPGTRYGSPYIINDPETGQDRQIVLDDLYNEDLNYHFSDQVNDNGFLIGRRISFEPIRLNSATEYAQNISVNVDLTGVSARPRTFEANLIAGNGQFFSQNSEQAELGFPLRKGKFNLDNYNSWLTWQSILLTPRHILMCGHCYSTFCDLTGGDEFITHKGARTLWPNFVFIGKNNQIYRPFNTEEEAVAAADNGTFRLLRCAATYTTQQCNCPESNGTYQQIFNLVELPNADWVDVNQVKYYDKIIKYKNIFDNTILYTVRGSGHVVVKEKSISDGLLYLTEEEDPINAGPGELVTGDSFSGTFTNLNNETVLAGIQSEAVRFTDEFFDRANEFMKSSGYSLKPAVAGFQSYDLIPSKPINSSFFSNQNTFLNDEKYDSRFLKHDSEGRGIIQIGFKPGTNLQASELNEMQDNFSKQYTLSNTILSDLIAGNLKNNTKMYDAVFDEAVTNFKIRYITFKKYFTLNILLPTNIEYIGPLAIRDINSQFLIFDKNKTIFSVKVNGRIAEVYNFYYYKNTDLSDKLSFYLSESGDRIVYMSITDDRITDVEYELYNKASNSDMPNSGGYSVIVGGSLRNLYSSIGEFFGTVPAF